MNLNFPEMEKECLINYKEVNVNKECCIQKTQDIGDIKRSHKRCGEIYMNEAENFKFVCVLCEKSFFTNIGEFVVHVTNCKSIVQICNMEIDPLEARGDYDTKCTYINIEPVILKEELTDSLDLNTDVMSTNLIERDAPNSVLPNSSNVKSDSNLVKTVAKNKADIDSPQLFSCNYCEKKYSWRDSLRRHLKRTHPQLIGRENTSKTSFPKINETNESNINSQRNEFSCDKNFFKRNSLRKHLKDEHLSNMNTSTENSKIMESSEEINEENSKVFIFCDILNCTKKFKKKESLDVHKRFEHKENSEEPMVEENDCSKDETNKDNSEEIRKEFDRYTCKYCEKHFVKVYLRIQHERIHTGEQPYKCSTCGKGFRANRNRIIHERIHQNIKPYKCDICNAAFLLKSNLTQHIQRHFGNKKYQCIFCEKRFHSSTEKLFHERTHTGEKSYLCFECGKCFSVPSKLNTHIKRHSGVKPFKCDQCDKTFFSKQLLKDHYVVHTREKPFTCHVCNSKFPRRKSLKSHLKIHSDIAQYTCNICGKSFKQGPGLYSHMKSHGKVLAKP